jgi:hypothetical protein
LDFKTLMKERQQVAAAYVSGDAEPLGRIVAQQSPASFMSPGGGVAKGTQAVWSRYENDASRSSRAAPPSWRSSTWRLATPSPAGRGFNKRRRA